MKVVTIDNFFKDPDFLVEYSKSFSYRERNEDEVFEGIRAVPIFKTNQELFNEICVDIIKNFFNIKNFNFKADLYFHKTKEIDRADINFACKIHKDSPAAITSALIYLKKDAPINSGTTIYRKIKDKFIADIVVENKYNRLIAFSSEYDHAATDYFGTNDDNCRLVLLFFLYELNILDK
jgi:hypothetical protein